MMNTNGQPSTDGTAVAVYAEAAMHLRQPAQACALAELTWSLGDPEDSAVQNLLPGEPAKTDSFSEKVKLLHGVGPKGRPLHFALAGCSIATCL